jgi:hypothetical protein
MAAGSKPSTPGESAAGAPRFEHRVTVDLPGPLYLGLRDAAYRLLVPATSLLRAMLAAWLESPTSPLVRRAGELAQAETAELRRRK